MSIKCKPMSNTVWGECVDNHDNVYCYHDGESALIEKVYASREELIRHLEKLMDALKKHRMIVPLSVVDPGFIFCDGRGVFHTIRDIGRAIPTQSVLRLASKPLEERSKG